MNNRQFYLARIIELLEHSPVHQSLTINEFLTWFIPPIDCGQIFTCYRNGKLLGCVTYAFVNDEAHSALLNRTRALTPEEWTSGEHVWVTEFIAPHGHALMLARAIKTFAETQGLGGRHVHFLRRYAKRKSDSVPELHWPRASWLSHFSH
jgi:hemolysin-activating ACP:hemolysin acyltransferase